MCYKTTFDSTTKHLNRSQMFLTCLLLDLISIDLTSIVHLDKIWGEIAKKIEMRASGGGGVVSDFGHPRTRGGGGVEKGQISADVLYGWPLIKIYENIFPLSFINYQPLCLINPFPLDITIYFQYSR